MPSWVRHVCWNFCGPFFAQSSKLPGKVSVIISGVGAKGHLAAEALGLGHAACTAAPRCCLFCCGCHRCVSPEHGPEPTDNSASGSEEKKKHAKNGKGNSGPGGAHPSGWGELSPSGTWGCTPISGGRTLTLRDLGVPAHRGGARTLTLRDLGVHAHQREANSHPQTPDGLRRSFWWEGQ